MELDQIQRLLREYQKDRVIIIDEAYIDFGGETAASLILENKNLLITKTFSKSRSLAGIRLGYALGQEPLIQALFTTKDSFNSYPIDTLAQNICSLAIDDADYYRAINTKIMASREILSQALSSLGWRVLPSKANFLIASFPGIPGKELYLTLKNHGILVRYFDIEGIKDFIRITIGTEQEINLFLDKIKELFTA